ncbi:MAG: transposase [Thaumarchaeota archaeon]|nr:transposase [Nitrososphaerota archaeon]
MRRRSRWYSIRTHSTPSKKRDFRKLHLASECRGKDKPIYSWTLTSGARHDSPIFRTLLKRVHGEIGDVCADKADSCRENATLVSRMGGNPFLMPKSNASSKAKGSHAWKEMMLFRERRPEEFERRYHKRSNAESTNASLKGKYGEFLRSRRWHMQEREVGLRVISHNIRRLIRHTIRREVELLD